MFIDFHIVYYLATYANVSKNIFAGINMKKLCIFWIKLSFVNYVNMFIVYDAA